MLTRRARQATDGDAFGHVRSIGGLLEKSVKAISQPYARIWQRQGSVRSGLQRARHGLP